MPAHIFKYLDKEHLFTHRGYEHQIIYKNLALYHFYNQKGFSLYVLTISEKHVMLFSQGEEFISFLTSNGVEEQKFEISDYSLEKGNIEKFEAELKNGTKLEIHLCTNLEFWGTATLFNGNEQTKIFDFGNEFSFPLIEFINDVKVTLDWSGTATENRYKSYFYKKDRTKRNQGRETLIGCGLILIIVTLVLYFFVF